MRRGKRGHGLPEKLADFDGLMSHAAYVVLHTFQELLKAGIAATTEKQIAATERINIMREILKCVASDIVARLSREKGNPDRHMAKSRGQVTRPSHIAKSGGAIGAFRDVHSGRTG